MVQSQGYPQKQAYAQILREERGNVAPQRFDDSISWPHKLWYTLTCARTHALTHTQTYTQIQEHTAEVVNNWWCCGCLVDAKAPGWQKCFCHQLPNRAGCLTASVCVHDTSSHVKRRGCLSHCVIQQQQIRAQIWKKCELIITSDWLGLKQSWGHLQCDWLALKSVENLSPFPFLPFLQCSWKWFPCTCVCTYSPCSFVRMQVMFTLHPTVTVSVIVFWLTWPSVQAQVTSSSMKQCWKRGRL